MLHQCALNNRLQLLQFFLEYMEKSSEYEANHFVDWVNASSLDEGFTALHLASYKGNIVTFFFFILAKLFIYCSYKSKLSRCL